MVEGGVRLPTRARGSTLGAAHRERENTMKLSVWKHPNVDDAVIEDEDTGHLFVPLDEHTTQTAAKLVAAVRGTELEELVSELIDCLTPEVNGRTRDAWLAAVGYTERERLEQFGVI